MAKQMEAIATSESVEDLFQRLERAGVLLRLDPDVEPTMYHAATISRQELDELSRIDQVIRMGRVQRITEDEILLDGGTLPTTAGTVHVDCTASAVGNLDPVPVFQSDRIVPQTGIWELRIVDRIRRAPGTPGSRRSAAGCTSSTEEPLVPGPGERAG